MRIRLLAAPGASTLMRRAALALAAGWAAVWVAACAGAPTRTPAQSPVETAAAVQPEAASGSNAKPGWATRSTAVAAANPLAAQAGLDTLRAGGSAIDAAVAMQMVLGLVEPQSSGLGGGAFLLHFDGKAVQAWDGRETAPAAATESLFMQADGNPMPFAAAVVGGRSVGVPGAVAMLQAAHRQHGKLPWANLFAPAIALAEGGFAISPRLHALLAADKYLKTDPLAAAFYYDANGQALPTGTLLKNPEYAAVLRIVAAQGSQGLLEGDVARAIVAKVRGHASNPGVLTEADLRGYQPVLREPLCVGYTAGANNYRICGMPPPSSGAIAVGQILGLLEGSAAVNAPALAPKSAPSADWLHFYTEAARLAFADRAQYVADPTFVAAPAGTWASLLAPPYLAARARLMGPQRMPTAAPGSPSGAPLAFANAAGQPEYGTSHFNIVDAFGNALAMTTTVEDAFGARQLVNRGVGLAGGFLLNNQLTDFSFAPTDAAGTPVANRVQPGKRPRSSMSPTLVFDAATGQLVLAVGSSGGPFIIHDVARVIYSALHWGINVQEAINLPNFGSFGGPILLEEKRFPPTTLEALRARGHQVRELVMTSGLQAVQRTPQGWFGGADPRREGVVLGD